jgi:hypothetical protein
MWYIEVRGHGCQEFILESNGADRRSAVAVVPGVAVSEISACQWLRGGVVYKVSCTCAWCDLGWAAVE